MTLTRLGCAGPALLLIITLAVLVGVAGPQIDFAWKVHDPERPQPAVVTAAQDAPPSDAEVLLGTTDLSAWRSGDEATKWSFDNSIMTIVPGSGAIHSRAEYGDCQLHLEWMIPADREVGGQSGGNSGVFFMDRYEVQILQSHDNTSYADGGAGAVYGQYPALVNPCRPAGRWNVYDIVFRAPTFDKDGSVLQPAVVTAFFNGVLVQDNAELLGTTVHQRRAQYTAHAATGPLQLQDHGDPINFRNIWVRRLPARRGPE